ncbi:MAG: hypothetical protein M0Z87_10110 [Actinomycetota bacterium]|nr:hypothetical protein [Actinomycetota bacterium]
MATSHTAQAEAAPITAAAQRIAGRLRASAARRAGGVRASRTRPTQATHSGDAKRVTASRLAATPSTRRRPTGGARSGTVATTSAAVQHSTANEISIPLGFTMPPRKIAMGVTETASPAGSRTEEDQVPAMANARPSAAALTRSLSIRIASTAWTGGRK